MPNWCENKIVIKDNINVVNSFVEKYIDKNGNFDFNRIIPEPIKLEDCPKGCIVNEDSHIQIDSNRPWFNWFEWHIRYWGTKWNACDTSWNYNENTKTLCISFSTAWCPCIPVISKLRELEPALKIKHYYLGECDEYGGYSTNNSVIYYTPGTSNFRNFINRFYGL